MGNVGDFQHDLLLSALEGAELFVILFDLLFDFGHLGEDFLDVSALFFDLRNLFAGLILFLFQ